MIREVMSPDETIAFGLALGRVLKAGDVISLSGDLGAGKTYLTKGIAQGLSIWEVVTSPTYTIMQIYDADLPLYHFDLYRLERAEELQELGFDEYIYGQGVSVIEWAEKFPEILPNAYLAINISYIGDAGSGRKIELKALGERYHQRLEELKK